MNSYTQQRIGSMIAGAGTIWAAHVATRQIDLTLENVPEIVQAMTNILLTTGPMEVCGLGIIVWLHAKWRRTIFGR